MYLTLTALVATIVNLRKIPLSPSRDYCQRQYPPPISYYDRSYTKPIATKLGLLGLGMFIYTLSQKERISAGN